MLKSGEIIPSIEPIVKYFIREEGFSLSDFIIEEWKFNIGKSDLEIIEIEDKYGPIDDFYHPYVKDQKYSIISLHWEP